jgi:aspartyl-tRNA(Asn)/glutamyl-tRNA(Gln) amidotransferase subunit B
VNEQELLGPYKLVLGFEIHLEPKTELKMFCGCSADTWGAEPNTHTCPVCLGLPGALPVPNFEAIKKAQLLGLALNCTLNQKSRFDRKHYFYPDLPKGYQISQYKQPLCINGSLKLESGKVVDIERVHMEEDVAKSLHEGGKTLIDFNKSGMPLIEIVTRPCFDNLTDAVDYCKQVQNIARYIGIGDADMEKGQLRLEVNISLRTAEMEQNKNAGLYCELAPYKVEVKNINSFRFMEKAVRAEISRQREIWEAGGKVAQENRGYDEAKNKTVSQRDKEEANDYRYFPEPDIPPMAFSNDYIADLKAHLPEVPSKIKARLIEKYKINDYSAKMIVDSLGLEAVKQFEAQVAKGFDAQKVANIIVNKKDLSELTNVPAESMAVADITELIKKAIDANPKAVEDFKKGKENAVMFLVGVVMRESKGKANASEVRDLIVKQLL